MIPKRIGRLRNRVEIQARTLIPDTYGEPQPTWATIVVVWAAVEPLSGRESWQAQQAQSDVSHKVTVRAWPGLVPKHRFRYEGRVLEITSVADIEERGRYMECLCVERT